MKQSTALAACMVLIVTQAVAAELPTQEVTTFVQSTYALSDYTLPSYDREKAVTLIQAYVKENASDLSDFDVVRLLTRLGDLFTGNCKPGDRDAAQGLLYFQRAVERANGRLSVDALRAALAISNLLDDRHKRLTGEVEHFMFMRYLDERSDEELSAMLLKPGGTPDSVAKESKLQLTQIRNMCKSNTGFRNIQSMAKDWYSREVVTVNDAYWLLLTTGQDEGKHLRTNH